MKILTHSECKYIEWNIGHYHKMKDEIRKWRNGVLYERPDTEVASRPNSHSDPTAAKATRLATLPMDICAYMKWVDAIDRARAKLDGSDAGRLFDEWYWRPPQSTTKATLDIPVGKTTFYEWRKDVVITVAIFAVATGAFNI